jgi:hypothetical protein
MFPYPPKLGVGKVFPNPDNQEKEKKDVILTSNRLNILKLHLAGYLRVLGIKTEDAEKIIKTVESLLLELSNNSQEEA